MIIELEYLGKVEDFLGDARSWKEWFASITTAVIQMNPELAETIEEVALRAESFHDWGSLNDWLEFSVQVAKAEVLNQEVSHGRPDRFAALGLLAKRYNPKTPSRCLHALTQVSRSPTSQHARQRMGSSSARCSARLCKSHS